jgi:CheY-like chemotaxis protein
MRPSLSGHSFDAEKPAIAMTFGGEAPGDFAKLAGLTVLVADDEEVILTLYREMIVHSVADATVIVARNGTEALAHAHAHQPDIILMDLAMPLLDGLAATKALKAEPDTAGIPVVACTGQVWDSQGVLDAGCAALLTKPFGPMKLMTTLADVLKHRGVRARRMRD